MTNSNSVSPLVHLLAGGSIQFGAYNQSKQYLTRVYGKETSTVHLCSAIVAGIATVTTMSPVWFIKTRMQLQNSKGDVGARYRNSWDCLMKVVRNEGPLTLYRGLSASLVGVSEGTIQWVLYERMKRSVNAYNARHHDSASAGKLQWLQYFGCAASAKLLAAAITYPHEVIRTRLRESPVVSVSFTSRLAAPSSAAHMVSSALSGYPTLSPSTTALRHHHTTRTMTNTYKYSGFVQTGRLIVQEEGVAALYSGMTAHLMRVVPNAAIMFVCYEGVVHFAKTFYDD
ncbi:Pyrimidine nucleotide transporter, mitochondrial [Sorochytrium milnesiophthora]